MRIQLLAIAIPWAIVSASHGPPGLDSRADDAGKAFRASISVKTATGPIRGRPSDLKSARAAVRSGNYTSQLHFPGRERCPSSCSSTGLDASTWSVYGSLDRLHKVCDRAMLLSLALFNPVGAPKSKFAVSACTADLSNHSNSATSVDPQAASTCAFENVRLAKSTTSLQLASSGPSSSTHVEDVLSALSQLRSFSDASTTALKCNETIIFASSGAVVVGAYSGAGLAGQDVLGSALDKLTFQIRGKGAVDETLHVQLCRSSASSRYSMGITVSTSGDFDVVQHGLQAWKNGTCRESDTRMTRWEVSYLAPSYRANSSTPISNRTTSILLDRDSTCRAIQVHFGDTCESLAGECGLTPDEFTVYNPSKDLCSGLDAGQHICCSAGVLPDFKPKPDADGYCHSYKVNAGDSCSSIGAANDLTNEEIESFNKDTWGWNGCVKLFAEYNICLSRGFPPMPATVANAVCGPQVNGTAKAPPGTDLSTLNQCPLNTCCNTWGQCGTTSEFCTISKSETGAPGTAAPGENGCISNCGTDIVASSAPTESFKIAYYEAYSWSRPCLRMPVTSIDTSRYTHIHFSFITLNEDFSINTDDVHSQMPLFSGMTGIKKIVSLGGWSFSAEPATYAIMRNAVASEANRQTVITNVIKFLDDNNLDGIDWDWEYPDEPDIPDIPAGTEADSTGYFLLLDELKQQLPAGKTVSVTAPGSFWYLQHFPIQALSLVVDYMVYMTYDLHGQWDYSNKYASEGCGSYSQGLGNCLRSHVNLTETINSLSMITKAGVPSNMIAVGVSSYGRSFEMSTPGCWTEQCTYTGPESGAFKGQCTDTAGYISDYEIGQILAQNPSAQSMFDEKSYSNIVVFNETQWVAYMDQENKEYRSSLYPGINFLGIADWAVDLQSDTGDDGGTGGSDSNQTIHIDPQIWNSVAPRVTAPPGVTLVWPPMPLATPTTITFPPWTTSVTYSSLTTSTSTLPDGSISTGHAYGYVSWLTVVAIPPGQCCFLNHLLPLRY